MTMLNRNIRLAQTKSFSPSVIYGLKMWIDISDLRFVVKDVSNKISLVVDKSGNGNDATQATDAKKPILTVSSQSNRQTAVYNGSNSAMGLKDAIKTILSVSGQYSIFAVCKTWNLSAAQTIIAGTNSTNDRVVLGLTSSGSFCLSHYTGSYSSLSKTATTDFSILFASNNVSKTLTVNSVAPDGTGNGSATGSTFAYMGAATGGTTILLSGNICEVLVFNREIGATEINAINKYLKRKWNIN